LAVVPGGPPRGRAAGRAAASEARFAEAAAATVSGRRPRLTVRRHDRAVTRLRPGKDQRAPAAARPRPASRDRLGLLDPRTGQLTYASAGHPAPVHLGRDTGGVLDVAYGPPLGTFACAYTNAQTRLTADDYLVLYTDGVTEARDGGAMYGEQRLVKTVVSLRGLSAQELADGLLRDVAAYASRLADDIQIVALRRD
jgi:hypothetical protein